MQTNLNAVNVTNQIDNGSFTKASYYFDSMNMETVLAELKPILRLIVQSLAYVHMVDSLVVYSYNLIYGNEMLRALCKVHTVFIERTVDADYSIAGQLLVSQAAALLAVSVIVLLLYDYSFLKLIYQFAFTHNFTFNVEQLNELKSVLFVGGLHIANYVAISVTSLIFIYTMIVFARYIGTLQLKLIEEGKWRLSFSLN